ncbi:hypothetical protein LCGC14_2519360, partial [marine sediment metagenome]
MFRQKNKGEQMKGKIIDMHLRDGFTWRRGTIYDVDSINPKTKDITLITETVISTIDNRTGGILESEHIMKETFKSE